MPSYSAVPVANSLLTFLSAASVAAATITSIITTTRSSSLSSSSTTSAFSNLDRDQDLDLGRGYKLLQARNQTPRLLSKNVPVCALPCLETFISSEKTWEGCPKPLDAICLCKARSTTGFTVAEAALRCVAENCPNSEAEQHAVYALCSGVEGALPNTHPVIGISSTPAPKPTSMNPQPPAMTSPTARESAPAPPAPTPPAPVPAPGTPVSDTLPSMSMMEQTTQITASPMSSVTRSGIPGVGIPTDTIDFTYVYSSTETGAASATSEPSGGGRSNQLVGLYVGGGIAFASLITLVLFFFFLNRRRRRAKQGQESEKGGQQGRYQNIEHAMANSRTTTRALSTSKASSNNRSISSRSRTLLPIDMMPCSVAYLQRSTRDLENEYAESRGHSMTSQRTQSDLLPDNPYNGSSVGSRGTDRERVNSPFGDACSSRGPSPKSVSQSVVDPLRSASSLNYSPALVQANQRSTQSPHSFNSGLGYSTNSPSRNQGLSAGSGLLSIPSKAYAASGRSSTSSRDQFQPPMPGHLAPPYNPEPFSSRSIHSYNSHIPRQLSPVREVPSTGPPSSAGTPDLTHSGYYRPGQLSSYAESDGASEMSIRTYSKLVPPPLSTHETIHENYLAEALPDHSPTLPKAMLAGSISSCCSSPRSSGELSPRGLRHQTSTASSKKPSSLLVKRRGERVAGKMGNEITLPAKVQRPIEIEHDQIHDSNNNDDSDNDSINSSSPLSRSNSSAVPRSRGLPRRMRSDPSSTSKGYNKVTPSKRGGDMYLSIE
ncbi:hypothetical protein MGYG_00183 [Nannizzia gypsea CBS 118893]|uniref:CFEM domain-containing protein n=1 Tax=Arthroderma gypseum (strain ATCC MYA-4604 / CBS 118893) TaxID=535722 RepID=E5R3L6_ARTGP|nr:hypothetical protein MGYG_00183 [Nannizzia gypsea CBS 118893]EFQ97140.1 hypothetical protein MGYG_00183 [Nannizzia gypsea CBS 118893]